MPFRPPKPCNHPGCPALVHKGAVCARHKKERTRTTDARRGSAHARGYTRGWEKYRRWYLRRHPVCVEPGCTYPATEVDHIIRHKGQDDPLFWDESNHQALCKSCHSRKTGREQGQYSRAGGGS